jgi:uncharacterized protein YkwD/uncharacterized membrane protein required for colicin V production
MGINWVDLVLLLVVLASAALGWQRGFILSVLDLLRWVGSWLTALLMYKPLSILLSYVFDWSDIWRQPTAFILVLFVSSIALHLMGRALLQRIPPRIHYHRANRLFGIIPGLISGTIMAVYTDEIEDVLVPVFHPAINQTLNRLITIEPGSEESVELPFRVTDSKPMPDLEWQMLELVNHERTSRGLKPLTLDPELTPVARAHSADMFARGYFSHYTPDGEDPFDRMREADVKFRTAGENLALAPTLQLAHTGLMNSPGHRANILNPNFGRVGIGIMSGGRRGIMVSQEFRN